MSMKSASGLLGAACAFLLFGCAATESKSMPDSGPVAASRPSIALPIAESPDARNERLLRLEWACDQWWIATEKQEYERQASMSGLIRTYVHDHWDAIVSDLRFGSPRHRRTMSMALGFDPRQAAVEPLTTALKDQYYEVVLHSLLSLYHLAKTEGVQVISGAAPPDGGPAAIVIDPELIIPYLRHPRPEVRSNAALVLTRIVTPATAKSVLLVLVAATEDLDSVTREHAIAALGSTGDREVFPYLVKALRDPVQLVRIRAALAVGRLKETDGVPYLIALLADPNEKVDCKRASAKALSEILGTKEIDSLDPDVWKAAARKMNILKDS